LDNYIFYSNNDCDKLMCELSSRDTLIIDLHITIESKNKIIDNLNLELKTFEKNYEELDQKYNAICIQQLDVANGLKKMVESIKKHSIENDYFEKINETYTQQSDEFNKIQQIFDMDIKDEI
jgi:hypothetical protein